MTLGQACRLIRVKAGLTLRDVGARLGISHVHVCNIEGGKVLPSLEVVNNYRKKLGLNPYVLAWFSQAKPEDIFDYRLLGKTPDEELETP